MSGPVRRVAPPAGPGKPGGARRDRERARRARSRRHRWLAASAAFVALSAAVLVGVVATRRTPVPPGVNPGAPAPNGSFRRVSGAVQTISALRGAPTLLWFVSTWCSSCQAGTGVMARRIETLARLHVRVVELELAGDLGEPGPGIASFARQFAGPAAASPDWTFGVSSAALTATYDPAGYLDVYYLLDSAGRIVYVNSSPAATMNQLLGQAARLA